LEIITFEIWLSLGENRLRIRCGVIYPRLLLLELQHLTNQAAADILWSELRHNRRHRATSLSIRKILLLNL